MFDPELLISCFIRNEALRVAFIHVEESGTTGKVSKEFYSKLVKADVHGKDQVRNNILWFCCADRLISYFFVVKQFFNFPILSTDSLWLPINTICAVTSEHMILSYFPVPVIRFLVIQSYMNSEKFILPCETFQWCKSKHHVI